MNQKKKLFTIFLFFSIPFIYAGDAPLFGCFGEISNRILIYHGEGCLITYIPTSVFLCGIFISFLGILSLLITSFINKLKPYKCLLLFSPILAAISAFIFTSLFGWLGEKYFGNHSVKLFWSWYSVGAVCGGGIGIYLATKILRVDKSNTVLLQP